NPPALGEPVSREEAAAAALLEPGKLEANLPVQRASTGLPFLIVPLRDRAVLKRVRPTPASMDALLRKADAHGLYLVALGTEPGIHLHTRMFDRDAEDPATGSAAGACAAWMVAHGVLQPEARAVIAQGDELQRPSRIHVRASMETGKPANVRVGGNVIEV